jgi:anthranilate phosphoribosyltransferase
MASAFVLLKIENREVVEVHGEVEALPEVTEAHVISGVYEVFTMVHTDTMPAIEALVKEQIERIKGVSSTLTLIILEPEPEEAPDDIPPPEVP